MSKGSAEKGAEVIDEFEKIARKTLDKIIGILENDRREFEKSPITNNTCTIGLRSNKNIVHSEYIPVKRTVKVQKMASPKITTLKVTEALKIIPQYSVEPDQLPLLLKMIAATKLTGKAYNATRYKEIIARNDLKQIILNAFESPYGAANLQIELNIIKIKPNESVHSYNNRVKEIFQKLCNSVAVGKTSSQTMTLRENIGEQALAMQIVLMADKNIRTYNEVQDIFKNNETSNRPFNKNVRTFNAKRKTYLEITTNIIIYRHFSLQCRANSRPLNQYNRTQDGLGYVTYAYETCSYCNKRRHMADVCFKKQRGERGSNINSGNGRVSHATHGARAINYVSVDLTEIVSQSYSQQ
ncbi:protein DDB G0276689-like [Aphis craccivora]|uniref:Protein DDB G0276689-like n=1 Tax=Aphis craccivora TaxID=307492 RepID=A0A6G0W5M2_APHCR|nr:protein DDB G0276689-like [Aphis craccivora]